MIFDKMKMKTILIAATALLIMGCTSTVTLGPEANSTDVLGATAGKDGASLTLPFVKGELTPSSTDTSK